MHFNEQINILLSGNQYFYREEYILFPASIDQCMSDLMETDLKSLISNGKQTPGHLWPQGGIKSQSWRVTSGLR